MAASSNPARHLLVYRDAHGTIRQIESYSEPAYQAALAMALRLSKVAVLDCHDGDSPVAWVKADKCMPSTGHSLLQFVRSFAGRWALVHANEPAL